MEKRIIGAQAFPGPMPVVIVGAEVNGKPNDLAVAWITREFNP